MTVGKHGRAVDVTAFLGGSFCAEWLGATRWVCPVTSNPMSTVLAP